MKVKVKYFMMREITGRRVEEVNIEEGATVQDLLENLSKKYGDKFKNRLWETPGIPRQQIHFLLDGKNIRLLGGLKAKLREGSTLAIIPPLGGG
ncbi:TPA: MoaD/ThiS family protein [Candidatus Bathyarchaeota archaeon]|nr:MoaD/ThiS family protein [Candidatus Bathyarchaeota archaeon]